MLLLGAWDQNSLDLIYASGVDRTTASRLHLSVEDLKSEDSFISFNKHEQLSLFFSRRITDLYQGFQVSTLFLKESGLTLYFLFLLKENNIDSPWEQLQDEELSSYLEKSLMAHLQQKTSTSPSLEKILEEKIKTGKSILYKIQIDQTQGGDSSLYINPIVEAERVRNLFDKICGERVSVYSLNTQNYILIYPDFLKIDPLLLEHQLRTALSSMINLQMDWANLRISMKPLNILDEHLMSFLYGEYSEP